MTRLTLAAARPFFRAMRPAAAMMRSWVRRFLSPGRGIFFAIATFALAVVAQTLITNWEFVGGSAGVYLLHPKRGPWFGSYIEYLFLLMLIVAAVPRRRDKVDSGIAVAGRTVADPALEQFGRVVAPEGLEERRRVGRGRDRA